MDFLTNLNLNKNELQNVVIQNLSVAPSNPKSGQIYYNTTDFLLYQYNGPDKGWTPIGAPYKLPTASADVLGGVKVGAGLEINPKTGVLSATGGGVADAVDWNNVTSRPFETLNLTELEVSGSGKVLGIKAVPQDKVTGLAEALAKKISEVKVNGVALVPNEGSVDVKVPTKNSELQNDSGFISSAGAPVQSVNGKTGPVTLIASDVGALPATGGSLAGALEMTGNKITGVGDATSPDDAVNKKQLEAAITAIGTVFDYKGFKPSKSDLPSSGNKIGDIWYVEDEKSEYVWIKDSSSEGRWEQFGPAINLSGYLTKAGLAQTTGNATDNAMSQKAVSDALKEKANQSTVAAIPVVKTAQGTMTTSLSTVTVNYTGSLIGAYVKTADGEQVMVDITINSGNVVFTASTAPSVNLTCVVVYM